MRGPCARIKHLLMRKVEGRNGKLQPEGLGDVIAEAGTCSEAGDLKLPPSESGATFEVSPSLWVWVVKERFRISSLYPSSFLHEEGLPFELHVCHAGH